MGGGHSRNVNKSADLLKAVRTNDTEWLDTHMQQDSEEMARVLNNGKDENGMRAVHVAAENDRAQLLERFLLVGADPMLHTIRGNTALHIAARCGSTACIRVLLRFVNRETWSKV